MKFIQRLGYYLGGFSMGLIILLFFLNRKNASCAYSPNARTVKNISSKPLHYSESVKDFNKTHHLDSTTVINLIKHGDVDFSRSNVALDSCKLYVIEGQFKMHFYELTAMNCDSLVRIKTISIKK